MCNSAGPAFPGRHLIPGDGGLPWLTGCFHANPSAFTMMILLSVFIIKRLHLQITLLPSSPPLQAPKQYSWVCCASSLITAKHLIKYTVSLKIHTSLFLLYFACWVPRGNGLPKSGKGLPFHCNYECWVEWCKLKPLCTLTLQSNCLIKLVFPPERYINKWTVEQIKNT